MYQFRFHSRILSAAIFSFVALVPIAGRADIFIPGQTVPGVTGDVFGWSRGVANSTYSGWDVFEAVQNPGFAGDAFSDSTPDVGVFGTPSVINISAGALGIGSGNAYSPFVALDFNSIVNSGTSGGLFTRIVAQFQTGGNELDYSSIKLSSDLGIDGTTLPSFVKETGRGPAGGGGSIVDYIALFDIAGSQGAYRLDFNAAASSLSLRQFHLDTFTQSTAFSTPTITAVPEPSSFVMLGVAGSVVAIVYRRRRNMRFDSKA